MTKLSVNINKLATLRNARGGNNPNLEEWVPLIQQYGAHGITVHPRPDERHIRKSDLLPLKKLVSTELNIEGYPSSSFIELVNQIKPEQCTLVPDPPDVLTSNAGWNFELQKDFLQKQLPLFDPSIRISLFVEPHLITPEISKIVSSLGVQRAEIYTEEFANSPSDIEVLKKYRQCADQLLSENIELNAGHDLSLLNLKSLLQLIPEIKEVSIGHALICESLHFGMEKTIRQYLEILHTSD